MLDALADPVRLRLLRMLRHRELCVCELVEALGMPQYAVSRHLRKLRAVGLVTARRDGRWMHYRLDGRVGRHGVARDVLAALLPHLGRTPEGHRDNQGLQRCLANGRAKRCPTVR
jgi:ArsR family transcriptional regulator